MEHAPASRWRQAGATIQCRHFFYYISTTSECRSRPLRVPATKDYPAKSISWRDFSIPELIVEVMLNPERRIWIDRLGSGLADTGRDLPSTYASGSLHPVVKRPVPDSRCDGRPQSSYRGATGERPACSLASAPAKPVKMVVSVEAGLRIGCVRPAARSSPRRMRSGPAAPSPATAPGRRGAARWVP